MIWGSYTAWSTGFGFAAILTMAPGLSEMHPLSVLYLSVFGLMELIAYSIAMSRSYQILHVLIKKVNIKSVIKPTVIEVGVVIAILLVAGFLEEYMINATPSV
jgi:hypothetical protein